MKRTTYLKQNFQKIPVQLGNEEMWVSGESSSTVRQEHTYLASYAGSQTQSAPVPQALGRELLLLGEAPESEVREEN